MKIKFYVRWFLRNVDVAYESDVNTGKVKITVCFKDIPFITKEFNV